MDRYIALDLDVQVTVIIAIVINTVVLSSPNAQKIYTRIRCRGA